MKVFWDVVVVGREVPDVSNDRNAFVVRDCSTVKMKAI
jgi:hypothetical protein